MPNDSLKSTRPEACDHALRVNASAIEAVEREVRELHRANEILKLASASFTQAEFGRKLKS